MSERRIKSTIPQTKKHPRSLYIGAKVSWYYAAFLDAVCLYYDCGKTDAIKLIFEAAAKDTKTFPFASRFVQLCEASRVLKNVLTLEELFPQVADPEEPVGPFSWQWRDLQERGLEPKQLMKHRDYLEQLGETAAEA